MVYYLDLIESKLNKLGYSKYSSQYSLISSQLQCNMEDKYILDNLEIMKNELIYVLNTVIPYNSVYLPNTKITKSVRGINYEFINSQKGISFTAHYHFKNDSIYLKNVKVNVFIKKNPVYPNTSGVTIFEGTINELINFIDELLGIRLEKNSYLYRLLYIYDVVNLDNHLDQVTRLFEPLINNINYIKFYSTLVLKYKDELDILNPFCIKLNNDSPIVVKLIKANSSHKYYSYYSQGNNEYTLHFYNLYNNKVFQNLPLYELDFINHTHLYIKYLDLIDTYFSQRKYSAIHSSEEIKLYKFLNDLSDTELEKIYPLDLLGKIVNSYVLLNKRLNIDLVQDIQLVIDGNKLIVHQPNGIQTTHNTVHSVILKLNELDKEREY